MTESTQQPSQNTTTDQKVNDKEFNFRQLEKKYQMQLEQERQARLEAERLAREVLEKKSAPQTDEDDDDDEYVDKRKLKKQLDRFGNQVKESTQQEINRAVQTALYEERKQNWMKANPDFYEVMQHAEKFAESDPELAETILQMPEGFERQKLVYKNIKALGLHKEKPKEPSIQDRIDQNRRSPYYQPSNIGTAPYGMTGDFSPSGQKNAYDKLKELQKRLRI